jgi:hypothetical protein
MTSRLADLQKYTGYEVTPMESNGKLISSYFGENTFSIEKMKETLSKDVFQKVLNVIEKGEKLDLDTANAVAAAKTNNCRRAVEPRRHARAEKFFHGRQIFGRFAVWQRYAAHLKSGARQEFHETRDVALLLKRARGDVKNPWRFNF